MNRVKPKTADKESKQIQSGRAAELPKKKTKLLPRVSKTKAKAKPYNSLPGKFSNGVGVGP